MITEGEAAILLETTRRAFGNQSQSKQRSTLNSNSRAEYFRHLRIVPELEILTTFLDLTLNFVTLIGLPQWNGRFFWQASLFHLPPKFSVRSRSKVTGTEFGNCT